MSHPGRVTALGPDMRDVAAVAVFFTTSNLPAGAVEVQPGQAYYSRFRAAEE